MDLANCWHWVPSQCADDRDFRDLYGIPDLLELWEAVPRNSRARFGAITFEEDLAKFNARKDDDCTSSTAGLVVATVVVPLVVVTIAEDVIVEGVDSEVIKVKLDLLMKVGVSSPPRDRSHVDIHDGLWLGASDS